MLARLLLLFAVLIAAPGITPVLAQSSAQLERTKVELVAETARPAPGSRFTVGVALTPAKGWHTYWQQPGDAGMPPRAQWALPSGTTASEFRFPVPEPFLVSGLMNHVYSGQNILLADIEVPEGASGAFPLQVRLDWLVCDDRLCVPEAADLSLPLTIGDGAANTAHTRLFQEARAALPHALPEAAHFQRDGARMRIEIPFATPEEVSSAHFFPLGDDALLFASPQSFSRTEQSLIVETDAVPDGHPSEVAGLLRIERAGQPLGLTLTATPGEVGVGKPLATGHGTGMAWLPALGMAVLGGLLLNLMPCVFPILSLKALSLARAGQAQSVARAEGLSYTAGVVLVTTALGGAAVALAQAGQGAGWAFQLQNPGVILFLMLLTFAIGLNFAGLFELGGMQLGNQLAAKPGNKGAFFTGTLAAFVATPCTGPFMAGALGAALLLPPLAGIAVFAGLGFGLALPFLLLGFVPALQRRLPKPGPWMLRFRQILAVPMLLTALGLAWVLGRQKGVDAMTLALFAALLFALLLWLGGQRQRQAKRATFSMLLAALVALTAPLLVHRMPTPDGATQGAGPSTLAASRFSPMALQAALDARTPTFLYFTADWCVTCKVNEKGALSSSAVAESFEKRGIKVLVGDWTRPDPEIAHFLEQRGRAGIPLYLFYDADGRVTELPQLLTTGMLTAL